MFQTHITWVNLFNKLRITTHSSVKSQNATVSHKKNTICLTLSPTEDTTWLVSNYPTFTTLYELSSIRFEHFENLNAKIHSKNTYSSLQNFNQTSDIIHKRSTRCFLEPKPKYVGPHQPTRQPNKARLSAFYPQIGVYHVPNKQIYYPNTASFSTLDNKRPKIWILLYKIEAPTIRSDMPICYELQYTSASYLLLPTNSNGHLATLYQT